jgi:flavin-dependent dehydrogenase
VQLALRGVEVLVVEKQRFPRDKVCGDALMPDALRALGRAGASEAVSARGVVARRLVLYSPSRYAVDIDAPTLTIRRRVLDEVLAESAARAGAVIAQGDVQSIESDGRRVRLGLARKGATVTASIVLLATGADVRLLRQVATLQHEHPSAVAVRRFVRSRVVIDQLIVSFDRSILPGYAWVFPLPDGEYNVGCGIVYAHATGRLDLNSRLDAFLREFPVARKVMMSAVSVEPLQGATLRAGLRVVRRMHAPNVLAIGENLGATLPLSGEGIGKAMETGERAAEIVAAALSRGDVNVTCDFANYVTTLRPLYEAYRTGEAWLARPWLNDAVMRLVQRSPYARRVIAEIIDETADPAAIFSLSGIARMLLS